MSRYNLEFGKACEKEAVRYLQEKGYKVIEENYKTRLGEIDIIASDKSTTCFIEVKSRSSLDFGRPKEAISKNKQHKISQSALIYLKAHNLLDKSARFDVIEIIFDKATQGRAFSLIKDAFSLDSAYTY